MNLYFICQSKNVDYDTYDSAVVAAETEEQARNTHPGGDLYYERDDKTKWSRSGFRVWASPSDVEVELIGTAAEHVEAGVVCASFNAG